MHSLLPIAVTAGAAGAGTRIDALVLDMADRLVARTRPHLNAITVLDLHALHGLVK